MSDINTNVVEQTVRISARPETVWRYWTDPRRLCDWWGADAELDPRPGGVCLVTMSAGAVMRGEYVELVPYERLVFSFGWEPNGDVPDIPPGTSTVEITLIADAGDTILTLRHTGVPQPLVERYADGWAHFLPILVAQCDASDGR